MIQKSAATTFNRVTGLVVLEVRNSNPNGDPDLDSDPRTLELDGRGVISPVSFKRKLRDLVSEKQSPVWEQWATGVEWEMQSPDWIDNGGLQYEILEARGRDREQISKLNAAAFCNRYWDGRLFGNTFLESMKEEKSLKKRDVSHFISTGVVQVGVGLSIAQVEIDRMTQTNKAGVESDKDRGMAPLGDRRVRHGVYVIPFFVNPTRASRTGMTARDLDLFRFLLPHVYTHTASAIRPFVSVLHAWWAEHSNPLGSCPDGLLIDALSPRRRDVALTPSIALKDYEFPTIDDLPKAVRSRFAKIEDATVTSK